MTTSGPSTAAAGAGGPKPASHHHHHHASQSEAVKEKKDLASWWKNFKRSDKKTPDQGTHPVVGAPQTRPILFAKHFFPLCSFLRDHHPVAFPGWLHCWFELFLECSQSSTTMRACISSPLDLTRPYSSTTGHLRRATAGQHSICQRRHQPLQR